MTDLSGDATLIINASSMYLTVDDNGSSATVVQDDNGGGYMSYEGSGDGSVLTYNGSGGGSSVEAAALRRIALRSRCVVRRPDQSL